MDHSLNYGKSFRVPVLSLIIAFLGEFVNNTIIRNK